MGGESEEHAPSSTQAFPVPLEPGYCAKCPAGFLCGPWRGAEELWWGAGSAQPAPPRLGNRESRSSKANLCLLFFECILLRSHVLA